MKGSIRERSPGYFAIVIEQRNPSTGKRARKWYSFIGTKGQAKTECARLIAEMVSCTCLAADKMTVGQFMERWLAHVEPQVSPRTFERYAEIVRKNLVPMIGMVALTKLRPSAVSTAYANALASGRCDGKGGLAPQSVLHIHRLLNQAMAQAVRWQLLPQNPVEAVDPPEVIRGIMNTYDLQQTSVLIEAMRGTRLFIPTLLAVLLGMCRGEIAALRWKSVNLDAGQLLLSESVEQMNASSQLKPLKNGRMRTVALAQTIVHELRAHRAAQAKELLKIDVRLSDDHFVCTDPDGGMMQPTWITHEWIRLIRETELPACRFHDLRHAHGVHLLASGAHPKVASKRLGHSSVGITLDLYSHAIPEMQEDAVTRLDDALRFVMKKTG